MILSFYVGPRRQRLLANTTLRVNDVFIRNFTVNRLRCFLYWFNRSSSSPHVSWSTNRRRILHANLDPGSLSMTVEAQGERARDPGWLHASVDKARVCNLFRPENQGRSLRAKLSSQSLCLGWTWPQYFYRRWTILIWNLCYFNIRPKADHTKWCVNCTIYNFS